MTRRVSFTILLATLAAVPAAAQEPAQDGAFELTPSAYVQFDFRAFPEWEVTPGTGRLTRDSVEVRRLRAGLDGRWRRVTFELSIDPLDDDGVFVKDAYAQLRLSPLVRLRVGQFKVPGSRAYDDSARTLDFLERPALASTLAVGRDLGVRLDGRAGRVRYDAGVFAGDGVGRADRSGLLGAGRAVVDIAADLEIGTSISAARTTADDTEEPNGAVFRATSSYRFAEGLYVEGLRLRLGADIEWSPGPWRFTAEMLRLRDERERQGLDYEDLPPAVGTGISLSVVRELRRRLDAAARYDYLGLDDVGSTLALDSVRPRATNIRARAAHAVTLGSTWAARPWLRLIGNVGLERYADTRSAPVAGRADYVTLGARLQVEWR